MRIPHRFKLMGQTIEVVYNPSLNDADGCIGQTQYRKGIIELQPAHTGVAHSQQHLEQTFLHELFHWIFYMSGEKELRGNERLIEVISGLLHQALTTFEGGEDGK